MSAGSVVDVEAGSPGRGADALLLLDVARVALARHGGERWTVRPSEKWCFVTPPEDRPRRHGWKLHVSATPLSAPIVLARAAQVLLRHGCSFKFATDLSSVAHLVDIWQERGMGGKFITAYPRDDEHFRALAERLHEVTEGLAGPQILSDRPYRPGSLVHSRYGGFHADRRFTDDGVFVAQMIGPDGSVVDDVRNGWFSPPPWAVYPFADDAVQPSVAAASVLLGGWFRVHTAIRHANKGGVYRGTDERDGSDVIVKQARAHIGATLDGTDVRDRLRKEARVLEMLAPLRVAPALVALVEEQRDLFLVEQAIAGRPLDAVTHHQGGQALADDALSSLARRLVDVVGAVHQAGFVINDLKPRNAIATPDGDVVLVDVEHITTRGTVVPAFTAHYAAPEIMDAPSRERAGLTAEPTVDCFSLGVTLFCMVTGLPPVWVSGRSGARPSRAQREEMLARISRTRPALTRFLALIVGLTETDPAQRWSLDQAREYLAAPHAQTGVRQQSVSGLMRTTSIDRVIQDGIAQLQWAMTPHKETLWKLRPRQHGEPDPCNAWFGAAGGLKALARAYAASPDDQSLGDSLATAAAWVDARRFAVPRLLPGLAFGRAGTAWALHEAAMLLDDAPTSARARELAARLPLTASSADITHGLSGAGMTHLHLAALSGDKELRERAFAYAEAVLQAARHDGGAWCWPHASQADSALAGANVYGYAHGVAGTGAFLLATAQACADDDARADLGERCLEAAAGAAGTLLDAAIVTDDLITWPTAVGGTDPIGIGSQWCNGTAGIGGFLIRYWAQTHEQRFADMAVRCAATGVHHAWGMTPTACCGLAGVGHFLLDVAEITGQDQFHADAEHIAGLLETQHGGEDDPSRHAGRDTPLDYGGGLAGILDFLIRFRHGGPGPWTPARTLSGPGGRGSL